MGKNNLDTRALAATTRIGFYIAQASMFWEGLGKDPKMVIPFYRGYKEKTLNVLSLIALGEDPDPMFYADPIETALNFWRSMGVISMLKGWQISEYIDQPDQLKEICAKPLFQEPEGVRTVIPALLEWDLLNTPWGVAVLLYGSKGANYGPNAFSGLWSDEEQLFDPKRRVVIPDKGLPFFLKPQDCLACGECLGYLSYNCGTNTKTYCRGKAKNTLDKSCKEEWGKTAEALCNFLRASEQGCSVEEWASLALTVYRQIGHLLDRPYRPMYQLLTDPGCNGLPIDWYRKALMGLPLDLQEAEALFDNIQAAQGKQLTVLQTNWGEDRGTHVSLTFGDEDRGIPSLQGFLRALKS